MRKSTFKAKIKTSGCVSGVIMFHIWAHVGMTASGVVAKFFKYAPFAFSCVLVSVIGILRSPVSIIEVRYWEQAVWERHIMLSNIALRSIWGLVFLFLDEHIQKQFQWWEYLKLYSSKEPRTKVRITILPLGIPEAASLFRSWVAQTDNRVCFMWLFCPQQQKFQMDQHYWAME